MIGLSDQFGGVYNSKGIDVVAAMAHVGNPKNERHSLEDFPGDRVSNTESLELPCDILVPAAIENQLTAENASKIKARFIAEGANGPTTAGANAMLAEGGVTIIPDILANAGGVVVSHFELVQDSQAFFWAAGEVNSRLKEVMVRSYQEVNARAESDRLPLRDAAYHIAVQKVAAATEVRGIYP